MSAASPCVHLPTRREQETIDLEFEGHRYAVSVGFDVAGQAKEVFVTGEHQGSTLDATLDDAAIVNSHYLQCGGTAEQLRRSMSRLGGGLGAAIEAEVAEAQKEGA